MAQKKTVTCKPRSLWGCVLDSVSAPTFSSNKMTISATLYPNYFPTKLDDQNRIQEVYFFVSGRGWPSTAVYYPNSRYGRYAYRHLKNSSLTNTTSRQGYLFAVPRSKDPYTPYLFGDSDLAKSNKLTFSIDRNSWYPKTSIKLNRVYFRTFGTNSSNHRSALYAGKDSYDQSYAFAVPAAPSVSFSYNKDSGAMTVRVKTPATSGNKERYDTAWRLVYRNTKTQSKETVLKNWAYTTSTDFSHNVASSWFPPYVDLRYGEYVYLRVEAYARGYAGNSSTTKSTYTVQWQGKPNATGVGLVYEPKKVLDSVTKIYKTVNDDTHNGRVQVYISFDANPRPDKITLQRLKSTATALDVVNVSSGWSDIATLNGTATVMSDSMNSAYPNAGVHVYYRFKTQYFNYIRYSNIVEAKGLFHEAPSHVPGGLTVIDAYTKTLDGEPKYLIAVVGFNSKTNVTGVEFEWADTEDALGDYGTDDASSHQVKSFATTAVTNDRNSKYKKTWNTQTGFSYTTHCAIGGLTSGKKYYLAARLFNQLSEDNIVYGPKAYFRNPATGVTTSVVYGIPPIDVAMNVPSTVEADTAFPIFWGYTSDLNQTSYTILYDKWTVSNGTATSQRVVLRTESWSSETSTTITADEAKLLRTYSNNGQITLYITVNVGESVDAKGKAVLGELSSTSAGSTTVIASPPSCKLSMANSVDSTTQRIAVQGFAFQYDCNQDNCRLIYTIRSMGHVYGTPEGLVEQPEGELVYSTPFLGGNTADTSPSITIPGGLDLIDGGRYKATLSVVNLTTGLAGEDVSVEFEVDYAHKAEAPSVDSIAAGAMTENLTASILPKKPANWVAGDVCDIYRVTPDGVYKIAEGLQFDGPVVDEYAPYSNWTKDNPDYIQATPRLPEDQPFLRYRLCTRTVDGSVAWRDVLYTLPGYFLRFDWAEGFLEVPFNLKFTDKYAKDVEIRSHMDGTRDGHWNPAITRTASLSTDIIKIGDPLQKERIKALAHYAGPVYVRTPDGSAYMADVQVDTFGTSYDSLVIPVSFTAEEIDLTKEFMIS